MTPSRRSPPDGRIPLPATGWVGLRWAGGRRAVSFLTMRLLRRHILGSVVGPFTYSLGACTGLLLINNLAKRFGDLVGKDLTWQVITEVLALSIPFIIALTLPMAVLVAILYGYSQLGADNEITAMRANGVSVIQMLRPALIGGAVLTILNFLFVDQVLPRTNARLRNLQNDISHKKPAFQMREQAINDLQPYSIRASRVFPGSGRLRDVEVFDHSSADGRRVIYADSGLMAFDQNQRDLIFRLYSGRVHEFKSIEPGRIQITRFTQNTIRIKDVQNLLERNLSNFERGDREMTTCEMMDQVTAARRQAATAALTRMDLVRQDLRSLMRLSQSGLTPRIADSTPLVHHCGQWREIERRIGKALLPEVAEAQQPGAAPVVPMASPVPAQDTAGRATAPLVTRSLAADSARPLVPNIAPPPALAPFTDVMTARGEERAAIGRAHRFSVEIHKKYTISVACFTFVLIGVPLALRFPRGGMGLVIGGGLLIFALFYICMVGGEALADRGLISAPLAMWFPNIVVFAAGIVGLIRVNQEFGSTRGGDITDLVESVKDIFRFRRKAAA